MHYLDRLAQSIITAYEDAENLSQWTVDSDRTSAVFAAVRKTLEKEIAAGELSYHSGVYPNIEDMPVNYLSGKDR